MKLAVGIVFVVLALIYSVMGTGHKETGWVIFPADYLDGTGLDWQFICTARGGKISALCKGDATFCAEECEKFHNGVHYNGRKFRHRK